MLSDACKHFLLLPDGYIQIGKLNRSTVPHAVETSLIFMVTRTLCTGRWLAAVGGAETAITELNCTLTLWVSCPQPAGREEGDGVQPGLLWKGSEATTRGAIRRGQCHV